MNEKACANGCIGVIIGPEDGYCYKCGAALVARPACEGCSRPYMLAVERFCPKCGKRLPFADPFMRGAEQAQKKVEGAA